MQLLLVSNSVAIEMQAHTCERGNESENDAFRRKAKWTELKKKIAVLFKKENYFYLLVL